MLGFSINATPETEILKRRVIIMNMEPVGENVVITAQQFNPSIINHHWLIKNNIIAESDILPNAGNVFVDQMIQLNSPQFRLLVVPEQLQFVPTVLENEQQKIIEEKLGAIVSKLPHTPYTAIGFNFIWHVTPENEDIGTLSKRLFFRDDIAFFRGFGTQDARFGCYLSKDLSGCRLKLDVKPIKFQTQIFSQVGVQQEIQTQTLEKLQFAFNFDKPLALNDAVNSISEMLGMWDQLKDESLQIMKSLN